MTTDPVRVVLRLRTLVPAGIGSVQSDVIDRLQRLEDEGLITTLDIDIWGLSMGVNGPHNRDPIGTRRTVAEFERWAENHDCTLRPGFGRPDARSTADGESEQRGDVVLPLLCLAVYDDATIRAVYPHTTSEGVQTIHDGLDVLESLNPDTGRSDSESNDAATTASR